MRLAAAAGDNAKLDGQYRQMALEYLDLAKAERLMAEGPNAEAALIESLTDQIRKGDGS